MANYKGVVRFISETQALALVEETTLVQDQAITSTGIGTGTGSKTNFSATLQPIINEGSLVLKVDGVADAAGDFSLSTSTGKKILTSTGAGSIHADLLVYTSSGVYDPELSSVFFGGNLDPAKENILDRVDGRFYINFSSGSEPGIGDSVTVSYTHDYFNATIGYDRIRMLRGDFSSVAVDDIIYYDYSTNLTVEDDTLTITRPGQA